MTWDVESVFSNVCIVSKSHAEVSPPIPAFMALCFNTNLPYVVNKVIMMPTINVDSKMTKRCCFFVCAHNLVMISVFDCQNRCVHHFLSCDSQAQMKCKTVFICVVHCILMHALSVHKVIIYTFLMGKNGFGVLKCICVFPLFCRCDATSPYIHPVGWCLENGRTLTPPPGDATLHFTCAPPPPPKKTDFTNTIMQ